MSTDKTTNRTTLIFWTIILILIAGTIMLNGISLIPYQLYQRLSQNPFITRTDIGTVNFWQETLLLPLIAFYTHWTTPFTFNTLCFLILLAAYILFAGLSFRRFGFRPALTFTLTLTTIPLTTVLFSWIGSSDGLTVLFAIPFLFTSSQLLILLLSVLGVTNHIVFIISALEILTLRWITNDKIKLPQLAYSIAGGALGYILSKLFFTINHIHILSRLEYMLAVDLNTWVKMNISNFPLTFLSLFNIQWLLLLICSVMFFKRDKRFFSLVWMMLLLNYEITFFTLDTTRIFSLLSWGVLIYCLFHCYRLSIDKDAVNTGTPNKFIQVVSILGLIALFMPRFYSWEGNIHLSPFFDALWRMFKQF